jgi:hypothetical protein
MVSTYQNKSFKIGYLSVVAVWKQFTVMDWFESFVKLLLWKRILKRLFLNCFKSIIMTIGLTGGIGGKTTIANHFQSLGIPFI